MLIGLTGRNASGKTTVVKWLEGKGFLAVSCSGSIRAWLAEERIDESRDSLIEGGREFEERWSGNPRRDASREAFRQ
ncbi:MAG: hypothetical protein CM1200mP21_10490 [Candidatus Poseidoniales archaeon]|nr:MAG: hypothetical protein CM1200mP21_10490 [Candidatus Poseidoniales archaeon]